MSPTSRCVYWHVQCVFVGPWYVTDHTGAWTKVVLSSGDTIKYLALAVDTAGKVHVAHQDKKGNLNYRTNTSGKWTTETVTTGVDKQISLVAGSATDVGIAYTVEKSSIKELWFARRSGTSWKHVNVTKDVSTILKAVRDKAGKVHVAAGKNDSLQIYQEQATGWVSLTKLNAPHPSNLAVDTKGALHLLFNNSGLFHATNSTGAWSTTKPSIPATKIYPDTLVVDATGNLYFAAAGSVQGDTYTCLSKLMFGLIGSCSEWPQVIYTNASGVWKASALSFGDRSMWADEMTGCSSYTADAWTTIHAMAIHGARLHLAYARKSNSSTQISGPTCTPMYSETVYVDNGHMIKCL